MRDLTMGVSERKTNMKKTILILMAALGLTISAFAQQKPNPWTLDEWLTYRTQFGFALGDKQAACPIVWYADMSKGDFNNDYILTLWLSMGGYGDYRDLSPGAPNIYIRKQAYVESTRVRLGGRPVYRFDSRGEFIGNNPAKTFTEPDFEIIKPAGATPLRPSRRDPPPDDGQLYSIIMSLSRAKYGWLYDYANAIENVEYPGSELIGFPIWPDNRPKVFRYWEPSDDKH
jgi:hypothetical protein